MSVYRTYVRPQGWDVSEADYRRVATAVRLAKRRNRTLPTSIFDFISSVLLLEHPPALGQEEAAERRRFALRMQQVTGPVTAKGVEDTAFYRYYPLASLNEVGGELDAQPLAPDDLHRLMHHRAAEWPHSMSATSTHDTKRGEDLRARLHVLSEVAERWMATIDGWHERNGAAGSAGEETVDRNAAYLLYQTLVGVWPTTPMDDAARRQLLDRLVAYMRKALREAKVNTSWMNTSAAYEDLVAGFVEHLLLAGEAAWFRAELDAFVQSIATAGFANGLSQTLLKITLPGVPDFYQGTELWDFNLVDPDNRRAVDFAARQARLGELERRFAADPAALAADVAARWPDPDVKLLVAWRALELRQRLPHVFSFGGYTPLSVEGRLAAHAFAFARCHEGQWALVVVPRLVQRLREAHRAPERPGVLGVDWGDAAVVLPPEAPAVWRNEFTGETIHASRATDNQRSIAVGQALAPLPVALFTSMSGSR
jgi:(1->4)-alpha-D-glucan 1-alpha-D-glucosylmutase